MITYAVGIVGCGGMGGGHAIAIASGTGNAVWNDDSNEGLLREGNMNSDISQKLTLAGVYDIDPARQKWAAQIEDSGTTIVMRICWRTRT